MLEHMKARLNIINNMSLILCSAYRGLPYNSSREDPRRYGTGLLGEPTNPSEGLEINLEFMAEQDKGK